MCGVLVCVLCAFVLCWCVAIVVWLLRLWFVLFCSFVIDLLLSSCVFVLICVDCGCCVVCVVVCFVVCACDCCVVFVLFVLLWVVVWFMLRFVVVVLLCCVLLCVFGVACCYMLLRYAVVWFVAICNVVYVI